MKMKYADRKDWKRITEKSWKSFLRKGYYFHGWVSILQISKVREPLTVNYHDQNVKLADAGYTWVQYFPKGESYTITVMLNESNEVVQWYIDICLNHGVTEKNVPWYRDLYLDIIIFPNNTWFLVDEDELETALKLGIITKKEYDYAYYVAHNLLDRLKSQSLYLMENEPELNKGYL
ncbi:DUF402 domain-containing protein [Bacillus sp. BGMRC 2118]|nr:DUF402 domain-containing protein [Bacillus sp. BGMRC 2118]